MNRYAGVFDLTNMIPIREDFSIDIIYAGIKVAKPVLGYVEDNHGNYKFVVRLNNGRLKYINTSDVEIWWSIDTIGRNYDRNTLFNKVFIFESATVWQQ